MGSELLSFLWKMKHFIFLFSLLVATSLSSPLAEDDRILGWLFKPDCSRPVFAPFGLYNPCPDTSTTTTAPTTTLLLPLQQQQPLLLLLLRQQQPLLQQLLPQPQPQQRPQRPPQRPVPPALAVATEARGVSPGQSAMTGTTC